MRSLLKHSTLRGLVDTHRVQRPGREKDPPPSKGKNSCGLCCRGRAGCVRCLRTTLEASNSAHQSARRPSGGWEEPVVRPATFYAVIPKTGVFSGERGGKDRRRWMLGETTRRTTGERCRSASGHGSFEGPR